MAFVTTFVGIKSGQASNAYNIDFSVGPGVRGNQPVDIMLVQVLFRIVHFEVKAPLPPPPGETGIAADGRLGPATIRFILNHQRSAKAAAAANEKVRLDGIYDPFRSQGETSRIAKVRYTFEFLNNACFNLCKQQGIDNYSALPSRTDIPAELIGALNQPRRDVARQYERGG